jgi:hypothetical protein
MAECLRRNSADFKPEIHTLPRQRGGSRAPVAGIEVVTEIVSPEVSKTGRSRRKTGPNFSREFL